MQQDTWLALHFLNQGETVTGEDRLVKIAIKKQHAKQWKRMNMEIAVSEIKVFLPNWRTGSKAKDSRALTGAL